MEKPLIQKKKKPEALAWEELNGRILSIQSDNGSEFKNEGFEEFCNEERIVHNFSSPRTLEQNRVVERKNRTLVEMARTMLL